MKFLRASALLVLGALALHGQTPDCVKVFQFTSSGQFSTTIDNRQQGCTDKWTVAYQSTGFSAVSLTFESASGAVSSGTFSAFSGSTVTGSNPMTSTSGTVSTFSGYAGWLRVKLTSATGSGTLTGVLYGYKTNLGGGGGTGGTCDTLAGDVTGTCNSNKVVNVNGLAYPSIFLTNSIPLVNGGGTVAYTAVPSCPAGGLGYSTSTSTFSCNPATHIITFSIDGGGTAISTGDLNVFPTAAFSCTISRVDVSGNPSGSIAVDIWKAAGAIPTSANKISASAPVTLSTAVLNQNASRAGWTTAVSSGDVFGATVSSATTIQKATVQITCA